MIVIRADVQVTANDDPMMPRTLGCVTFLASDIVELTRYAEPNEPENLLVLVDGHTFNVIGSMKEFNKIQEAWFKYLSFKDGDYIPLEIVDVASDYNKLKPKAKPKVKSEETTL